MSLRARKRAGSLDTNVVLRLLLRDVPDQHAAASTLIGGADAPFTVSDAVIIEAIYVLCRHYGFSRSEVGDTIGALMSLVELDCNRDVIEPAMKLFIDNPKLSFEDCYLATYATWSSAEPLWTFDKKLATQANSARLLSM